MNARMTGSIEQNTLRCC